VRIACEQADYGSFPFWDKGYAVLARSENCRDEWLSDFSHLCQSLGQPPGEAAPLVNKLILAKKLPSGPWLVCQGSAQGCDDRGRPGAWAFHGLFVSGRDYRRAGATPFAFRDLFLDHFHAGLKFESRIFEVDDQNPPDAIPFRETLIEWLARGRQIRLLTDNPANLHLLESLWSQLPASARRKRSITSWAFRPEVDFHLAALSPGRWSADMPLKRRNVWAMTPEELTSPDEIATADGSFKRFLLSHKKTILYPAIGLALAVGVRSCVTCEQKSDHPIHNSDISQNHNTDQPPSISRFESIEEPANLKMAIQEQLADWCERLEIQTGGEPGRTMQTVRQISQNLRYQGPSVQFASKESEQMGLAVVIDRCSAFQPLPVEMDRVQPLSSRYGLAMLAWSVGSHPLQLEAEKIQSPADARRWFEQLREYIIPEQASQWINSNRSEFNGPEWAEARLHLNRMMKLQGD